MIHVGAILCSMYLEASNQKTCLGKAGSICDRILENHPYGRILLIKYLVLKSSLKILFFVHLWFQYNRNASNYKEKCRNI